MTAKARLVIEFDDPEDLPTVVSWIEQAIETEGALAAPFGIATEVFSEFPIIGTDDETDDD